ncbi:MAG: hypothetical protein HY961_14310 [Ignavibacteriae bacterium]|nr:hypothetical protein [Ignavibacteriota bacterium]
MNRIVSILILLLSSFALCFAQAKFYNYYSNGLDYMKAGDWLRAIEEFKSAASLEFEDTDMRRTYGTRFIDYFPHREMGIAHYNLGEFEIARKELELSLAYVSSSRAEEYLERVKSKVPPVITIAHKTESEPPKKDESIPKEIIVAKEPALPSGALTYDPGSVTQVGERLAIAVLPLQGKGEAEGYIDAATDRMILQLVNLRRFKVIERWKMDELLKEQELQVSGIVDEKAAVEIGRVAGADAIILGNITVFGSTTSVSARVIDTQSSEVIIAKSDRGERRNLEDVEKLVETVAINIYNELPLVEGEVITKDPKTMYVDIGSEKRIRKGSKCVAFRVVGDFVHPKTGKFLQKQVVRLGELQVVEVMEKVSAVKVLKEEAGQDIKVGDRIVVK